MAEILNLKHERLPDYFTHLFLLLIKLRLKRDISCVGGGGIENRKLLNFSAVHNRYL